MFIIGLLLTSSVGSVVDAGSADPMEVDCTPLPLSCNIFMEARGEGILGMGAVSFSTLNRLDYKFFVQSKKGTKTTLNKVLKNPKHYSWLPADSKRVVIQVLPQEKKIWELSKTIAMGTWTLKSKYPGLYKKLDYTSGAVFYHAQRVRPSWASKKYRTLVIGEHHFYTKDKNGYPLTPDNSTL